MDFSPCFSLVFSSPSSSIFALTVSIDGLAAVMVLVSTELTSGPLRKAAAATAALAPSVKRDAEETEEGEVRCGCPAMGNGRSIIGGIFDELAIEEVEGA